MKKPTHKISNLIIAENVIKEELLNASTLVENKIGIYPILDCIKKGKYNLELCEPCPRFSECMDRLIEGNYIIEVL